MKTYLHVTVVGDIKALSSSAEYRPVKVTEEV
jgi:hypothetical protein